MSIFIQEGTDPYLSIGTPDTPKFARTRLRIRGGLVSLAGLRRRGGDGDEGRIGGCKSQGGVPTRREVEPKR